MRAEFIISYSLFALGCLLAAGHHGKNAFYRTYSRGHCTALVIPVQIERLRVQSLNISERKYCKIPNDASSLDHFANHCNLVYNGSELTQVFETSTNTESRPHFARCAVVSSSFTLHASQCGKHIDAHDAVFRMNLAPTEDFELDVGAKTTFQTANSHEARRLEQKQGEFEFNLLQRICDADTSILLSRDEWPGVDVPHRDEKISKYLNTHCPRPSNGYAKAYVLHDHFTGAGSRQLQHRDGDIMTLFDALLASNNRSASMPTTGMITTLATFGICDSVSLYGFKSVTGGPIYYYEPNGSIFGSPDDSFQNFHDLEVERAFMKTLNQSQIFRVYEIS